MGGGDVGEVRGGGGASVRCAVGGGGLPLTQQGTLERAYPAVRRVGGLRVVAGGRGLALSRRCLLDRARGRRDREGKQNVGRCNGGTPARGPFTLNLKSLGVPCLRLRHTTGHGGLASKCTHH